MTYAEIANRIRRAARNGGRLHLDPAHVLALLASPIYPLIAELESKELASLCPHSNDLDNSGLRGAPTARNGRSAGTTAPLEPAVESQQGAAISTMVIRQSKRNRALPNTSPATASPKPSTRTAVQA